MSPHSLLPLAGVQHVQARSQMVGVSTTFPDDVTLAQQHSLPLGTNSRSNTSTKYIRKAPGTSLFRGDAPAPIHHPLPDLVYLSTDSLDSRHLKTATASSYALSPRKRDAIPREMVGKHIDINSNEGHLPDSRSRDLIDRDTVPLPAANGLKRTHTEAQLDESTGTAATTTAFQGASNVQKWMANRTATKCGSCEQQLLTQRSDILKSMTKSGTTRASVVCTQCSAYTCLGCGEQLEEVLRDEHVCDDGRLLAIWAALCGIDKAHLSQSPVTAVSKASAGYKPGSPAAKRGPRMSGLSSGIGYGGVDYNIYYAGQPEAWSDGDDAEFLSDAEDSDFGSDDPANGDVLAQALKTSELNKAELVAAMRASQEAYALQQKRKHQEDAQMNAAMQASMVSFCKQQEQVLAAIQSSMKPKSTGALHKYVPGPYHNDPFPTVSGIQSGPTGELSNLNPPSGLSFMQHTPHQPYPMSGPPSMMPHHRNDKARDLAWSTFSNNSKPPTELATDGLTSLDPNSTMSRHVTSWPVPHPIGGANQSSAAHLQQDYEPFPQNGLQATSSVTDTNSHLPFATPPLHQSWPSGQPKIAFNIVNNAHTLAINSGQIVPMTHGLGYTLSAGARYMNDAVRPNDGLNVGSRLTVQCPTSPQANNNNDNRDYLNLNQPLGQPMCSPNSQHQLGRQHDTQSGPPNAGGNPFYVHQLPTPSTTGTMMQHHHHHPPAPPVPDQIRVESCPQHSADGHPPIQRHQPVSQPPLAQATYSMDSISGDGIDTEFEKRFPRTVGTGTNPTSYSQNAKYAQTTQHTQYHHMPQYTHQLQSPQHPQPPWYSEDPERIQLIKHVQQSWATSPAGISSANSIGGLSGPSAVLSSVGNYHPSFSQPSSHSHGAYIFGKKKTKAGSLAQKRANKTAAINAPKSTKPSEPSELEKSFKFLLGLLPDRSQESSFDRQPPSLLLLMFECSQALEAMAEKFRNESLKEICKESSLYHILWDTFETMARHDDLAAAVQMPRTQVTSKAGLEKLSLDSSTVIETREAIALSKCFDSVFKQIRTVLSASKKTKQDFEDEEGQTMISVCDRLNGLKQLFEECTVVNQEQRNATDTGDVQESSVALLGWTKREEEWHRSNCVKEIDDEVMFAHHHPSLEAKKVGHSSKGRMRVLIEEVASLETSLPPGIFVRYASSRLDVMKALIVGPADTPYENGLFEFDILCPSNYPDTSPKIRFKTTGGGKAHFNPNLYTSGKVCLSLLGTWNDGTRWKPGESTLLQVLVSIQSMILTEHPWYNEPGREMIPTNKDYKTNPHSLKYNQRIQSLTLRYAIIDWLLGEQGIWQGIVTHHLRDEQRFWRMMRVAKGWLNNHGPQESEFIKHNYRKLQRAAPGCSELVEAIGKHLDEQQNRSGHAQGVLFEPVHSLINPSELSIPPASHGFDIVGHIRWVEQQEPRFYDDDAATAEPYHEPHPVLSYHFGPVATTQDGLIL